MTGPVSIRGRWPARLGEARAGHRFGVASKGFGVDSLRGYARLLTIGRRASAAVGT